MNEELIGCFAKSKAGHDKETVYMVVGIDQKCVLLSDGRLKTTDHLKKKKLKHIQIIHQKDETIECKRNANQKIMNEDIKHAIKKLIVES